MKLNSFPNNNYYIACFSYFTCKDIYENTIFDDNYLQEPYWDNMLMFLNPKRFLENIKKSSGENSFGAKKVNYLDLSITHFDLDPFSKDHAYSWQKEFRIIIDFKKENEKIIKIDDHTIEVSFEPVESFILPTKSFKDGHFEKGI